MQSRFNVFHLGDRLGDITLNLPGRHNVLNAMASIAVAIELDISFDIVKTALETMEGVQRRMEIKGLKNGITVIDDYGHHPTEIKMTLQAVRDCWPESRMVVVFQPHRYSRTQALFEDFSRAFYQSDILVVLPIYSAGETRIDTIDSIRLAQSIESHGHKAVVFKPDFDSTVTYLKTILKPDDILLTLGAGDVWQLGNRFVET